MAKSTIQYPDDFLKVYEAFPKVRTRSRVLPYRSWCTLQTRGELVDVNIMLKAIESQKNHPDWQAGFVPMLSTWLNQKQWEAEEYVDMAKEVEAKHKQAKKEAFIERQRTMQEAIYDEKTKKKERLRYNLFKLFALREINYDAPSVYFAELITFSDVDLRCKLSSPSLSDACLICDTFVDVYTLKFKGVTPDTETLERFWHDYKATITVLLFVRHAQGNNIDALPHLVSLTDSDCINMRKVVTYLSDCDKTKAAREQYKIQSFFSPDDWFSMYPVEAVLRLFPEVH